eukprot:g6137.t1
MASAGKTQSVKGVVGSSSVDASLWVPDDMAPNCCVCKSEFTIVRRRHHCRTCGRVVCDDCSSNRIRGDRTCLQCWDRIGRKMSGLGLPANDAAAAAAATGASAFGAATGAAAAGGVRKSALFSLLEEERFNRKFVLANGRTVSYSIAGNPDGLPVFLFLGLDSHRHSAAQFEEPARRRDLQLICIDRPGRGLSDPIPLPEGGEAGSGGSAGSAAQSQDLMSEAIEAAVVDSVKQLCAKLRIGKAAMMGQSVGAVFALRCAREEELRDIFDGTTVCLVSPWVPLAAPGCNAFLQKASSMPALSSTSSTVGRLGAEIMLKQVGDMTRGSSGASEVETGYLEAPYTQDLTKHVSDLKEGKDSMKNEVFLALRNKGEDEAKERCAAALHPVKIWHGSADSLVPPAAMAWLERALPSCTSTVVPGGTHAFVYDKGGMEDVFAAAQKGVQEARSTARFAARRLGSQLSYVASNVFPTRDDGSSASASAATTAAEAAAGLGATAGMMSPRSGGKKKAEPTAGQETTAQSDKPPEKEEPSDLRYKLVKAISRNINSSPDTSAHSHSSSPGSSANNSRHNGVANATNGSGHGSGSEHGSGSGSGHSLSWHSSGGGGTGSGHGTAGRRLSGGTAGTSSRHGPGGGSRHGSETAPPPIPENGELGSPSPNGLLGEFGKQFSLALNGTFGGEGGGSAGQAAAAEGSMPPPPPVVVKRDSDAATSSLSTLGEAGARENEQRDADSSSHSDAGSMGGVGRMAEGFLKHLDRAVSSMSMGDGSAHGSGWGGSVSAAGGSTAGSTHGSGSVAGNPGGGGSRRASGILLPWSQQDVDEGQGEESFATKPDPAKASDDMVGGFTRGFKRAFSTGVRSTGNTPRGGGGGFSKGTTPHGSGHGFSIGTPGANDEADESLKHRIGRALTAVGGGSVGGTPRGGGGGGGGGGLAQVTPRGSTSLKDFSTPLNERNGRASTTAAAFGGPLRVFAAGGETYTTPLHSLSGRAANAGTPRDGVVDVSGHGSTVGASVGAAATHKRRSSISSEAAGYEAAIANWPAGKVPGNPAWEEWSPEKKLACHFVTAGCLAVIVATW